MDFMTSALILSWVAIFLLALVVSGLIRQVHQLSAGAPRGARRVGLAPGAPAPQASELVDGRDGAVLLFLSPHCRTCQAVLAEAGRWASRQAAGGPALRALYAGPPPPGGADVDGVPVLGDRADLFEAYDAVATPYAVVINEQGRVTHSEPLGSGTAVLGLLDSVPSGQPRSAR